VIADTIDKKLSTHAKAKAKLPYSPDTGPLKIQDNK
jgi:hypothetical protein